jgi:hypothetical protein
MAAIAAHYAIYYHNSSSAVDLVVLSQPVTLSLGGGEKGEVQSTQYQMCLRIRYHNLPGFTIQYVSHFLHTKVRVKCKAVPVIGRGGLLRCYDPTLFRQSAHRWR